MPFPQGGDFPRSVNSLFTVVKSDKRICVHDNGTDVCDQGHKLLFPGTCLNQAVGTFNSTDAAFQPTFPVCVSDYESSGFSNGLMVSSPPVSGDNIIAKLAEGTQQDHIMAQVATTLQATYDTYNMSIVTTGDYIIAKLARQLSSTYAIQKVPSAVTSFWRMAQFNPGVLPHREDTRSDTLFPLDVYSSFIAANTLVFFFIETLAARIKQEGDSSGAFNTVNTDYYTTISGSDDICVEDSLPPFVSLHNPTQSGIELAPRDQVVDFSMIDATAGVDISSVFVTLYSLGRAIIDGSNPPQPSGIPLVTNGMDATGGFVSVTGDSLSGYRFTYDPAFLWDFNEQVRVTISGADLAPMVGGNPFFCQGNEVNHLSTEINFQVLNYTDLGATITGDPDSDPPYVATTIPASGTLNNNVFTPVTVSIADDFTGVDLATLFVSIDGNIAVQNGVAATEEAVITGSKEEYTVVYAPTTPFTYGSTANVVVQASDLYQASPNTLDDNYDIGFIEQGTLIVENFLPAVGTSNDLLNVDIEVDIRDDSFGVDVAQSTFVINGTVVSGTHTPLVSGTHIVYHPPNDFDYGEPINVVVHAVNGNTSSPVVKDVAFTLYYGFNLKYFNQEPFQHEEQVNVYVRARNTELFYSTLTTGYLFTAYSQPSSDMAASICGIDPTSNLGASLTVVAPEHRYGEVVTVEIFVKDFDGFELGPLTYTYTIESTP